MLVFSSLATKILRRKKSVLKINAHLIVYRKFKIKHSNRSEVLTTTISREYISDLLMLVKVNGIYTICKCSGTKIMNSGDD